MGPRPTCTKKGRPKASKVDSPKAQLRARTQTIYQKLTARLSGPRQKQAPRLSMTLLRVHDPSQRVQGGTQRPRFTPHKPGLVTPAFWVLTPFFKGRGDSRHTAQTMHGQDAMHQRAVLCCHIEAEPQRSRSGLHERAGLGFSLRVPALFWWAWKINQKSKPFFLF